ncbi:OLC1v1005467C1 [Oldenlandia corymbosa var. corymbosa]|uniref:OLC1v1005467C1 n=1 Tax=Oldenlandia corymbosa var. corymbosa TaxID=529605 RepID=A0AAV1DHM2_OLDCO|nr:OLC1v1005467C1 [Oldenlandia corymbosa var. corymbosa]
MEWKQVLKHNKTLTISEEVPKEEAKIQVGKGEMIQRSKVKEKMTTSPGFNILMEVDEELQPIEGKKDTQHQLNLTSEHDEAKLCMDLTKVGRGKSYGKS